jgi:hypothetical protein
MSEYSKQWFGFLGSPIAWFFHLLVSSVVAEGACVMEGTLFSFLGITAAGWFLTVTTFLAIGLCLGSLRIAWRYRKDRRKPVSFLGKAGVISGLLFLLILLAQAAPIVTLLNGC